MTTSRYDIEKIRKKMAQKLDGRKVDPNEFRPPKAKTGETLRFRFYVLPELSKGDKVNGGVASRDMDLFVVKHGQHWVNNRPYTCPRLFNDEECDLCQAGFEALNEIPKGEEEKRRAVVKQWLASSVFAVNIYFPPIDANPEELRGRVMWYNAPKQVFDIWYAALSRDDSGDSDDPEAYGVFYDPYNAFLFQLVAKPSGSYNEYKSSKFIAAAGAHPIVRLANKKPDEAAIRKILDSRHDLFTKIEPPNPQKIHQLCQQMLYGPDATIPVTTPEDEISHNSLPDVPSDDTEQSDGSLDDEVPVVEESAKDNLAKTTAVKTSAQKPVQEKPVQEKPVQEKQTVTKPVQEKPAMTKPAQAKTTVVKEEATEVSEANTSALSDDESGGELDDEQSIRDILAKLKEEDE